MVKPFYNEQTVKVGSEEFRLVLNFATIDAVESLLAPRTFDEIVGELLGGKPPLATQTRVVWGLLREHHPELSIDQAMTIASGQSAEGVGIAVGNLIMAGFPLSDGTKAKEANPPKPRGASRRSSPSGRQRA